jgi:hypothetical protein
MQSSARACQIAHAMKFNSSGYRSRGLGLFAWMAFNAVIRAEHYAPRVRLCSILCVCHFLIMAEDEHPHSRCQIGVLPILVYRLDECGYRQLSLCGDLLQTVPKLNFESDACLTPGNDNRMLLHATHSTPLNS